MTEKVARKSHMNQPLMLSQYRNNQAIPGESPNTILTNTCVFESNDERTSNVLCPSGAYGKVFSWFLDLNQFARN